MRVSLEGRRGIRILALLTLVGFPLLGLGINYYFHLVEIEHLLDSKIGYVLEGILGFVIGIVSARLGWGLANARWMRGEYNAITYRIRQMGLSNADIIYISLCAGIGEEIFFRGILQPALGIWWTAVIFVAIHGYLRPDRWRASLYGIYMVFVIAALGYMRRDWGLTSAIAAHSAIDILLFYMTLYGGPRGSHQRQPNRHDDIIGEEE